MLKNIKEQFYNLIKQLNYKVSDNGTYTEDFPWLILRLNNASALNTFDLKFNVISLNLDIFSNYNGELEIIDITENITNHLDELVKENPALLYAYQKSLKILDDKHTGPVRKHGIATYEFIMGQSQKEVPDDTDE